MFRYNLYGMVIESEVKFIQLLETSAPADEADIVRIVRKDCSKEVMEYLEKSDALDCQYVIGMEYSCFMNKGGYYIIRDGKEIVFETKEGYTPENVSSWLLGYSMAMLLLQRKVLAIHCSAVVEEKGIHSKDGGAFLVAGEMGAGKSSLTRKLIERGCGIMADDVAAIRLDETGKDTYVYSAFPYQKLCRNEVEKRDFDQNELIYIDETKDKFLVPVKDKFVVEPRKLKFMIFLTVGDVDEVKIEKFSGLNQLIALRTNIFLHRLKGDWENTKEIAELALKLSAKCPVYHVIRPRVGDSQDRIADEVLKILNE